MTSNTPNTPSIKDIGILWYLGETPLAGHCQPHAEYEECGSFLQPGGVRPFYSVVPPLDHSFLCDIHRGLYHEGGWLQVFALRAHSPQLWVKGAHTPSRKLYSYLFYLTNNNHVAIAEFSPLLGFVV